MKRTEDEEKKRRKKKRKRRWRRKRRRRRWKLSANPDRIDAIRHVVGDLPERAINRLDKELKAEIKKGKIRPVSVRDLLITMVSLNLMAFMGAPMFKLMTGIGDGQYDDFLDQRKKENVRIVLKSLEPEVESKPV